MNRAKFVICRSGYTTMMELAEAGKEGLPLHPDSLPDRAGIPLVGDDEQKGWFFSKSQYRLHLPGDISTARQYAGIFC